MTPKGELSCCDLQHRTTAETITRPSWETGAWLSC